MSFLFLPHSRRLRRIAYWGLGSTAFVANPLYADQFAGVTALPSATNIQIRGSENWTYDSNPLRLVQNSQPISGFDTAATLILNEDTPTFKLDTNSEVDNGTYDNAKFDSTNFHEKMSLDKRNDRWQAGLGGQLDYDTTRTSEITNFGINIPDVRHLGLSIAPELDFSPNTVEKLSLQGSVQRSTYDNAAFTNYDFDSFYPTYSYAFDPLNTGSITVNYQHYATINGVSNTIDTFGPSVGWMRIIDPNMTVKFTAGAENSTQSATAGIPSSSSLNYVFTGNLSIKEQSDLIVFDASRNQQPFGNGSSALFTSFRATETHSINERLSVNGAGSYRYAEYLDDVGINLDREVVGSAGITYQLFNNLDIVANYQYTNQTLTNTGGAVKEQTVLVGLSFHPLAGAL